MNDSHCNRVHSPVTADHCFGKCYLGKQSFAWKGYCAGVIEKKELWASIGRCTDRRAIIEIVLKPKLTLNNTFNDPENKNLMKTLEKGENAGNQHFLLFQQCFQTVPKKICFQVTFLLSLAIAFNLDQSKYLLSGRVKQ